MERRLPVKSIGACLGMSAFAIAIVTGLGTGAQTTDILSRALVALLACYLLGLGIGVVADVAVRENLDTFENNNPLKTPASTDGAHNGAPAQSASPGASVTV